MNKFTPPNISLSMITQHLDSCVSITKKVVLSLVLLIATLLNLNAQVSCGTLTFEEIQQENPKHAEQLQVIEEHTQERVEEFSRNSGAMGVVTIPTVFHVIHTGTTSPGNNIQEAYILAQLQQMNDDFRRLNSDRDNVWSQAADTEIEFCLATVDPNGNSTTGIIRHQYQTGTWTVSSINNSIKPQTIWNRNHYLNVWLIPDPKTNNGGNLLGYAQFPGGTSNTDGVVNRTSSTGSLATPNPSGGNYGFGRTSTHEVGHWLNLRHIWGDQPCGFDDFVSDTPQSDAPNYGCQTGHVSCGSQDMVQNYMDYSDDACANLFTTGQKNRMQALFTNGARASLVNSPGCGSGGGGSECATDGAMTLTIVLDNYPSETTWAVTNGGTTVATGGNYNAANTTVTKSMNLPDGDYTFTIYDSYGDGICCGYGNGSYALTGGGVTVASGGNFTSSQATGFCVESGGDTQAPSIPLNLSASGTTETTTNLSWSASTDNVGVTAYNIYYQGSVIGTTSATNRNITGMSAGNSYTFHVTALDAAGNESGASNTVTVNTSGGGGDTQAPTRPLNLTASGTTETTTNLFWSASTDNVGVTAYNIYYQGSVIGNVSGTSANITGMAPGNTYSFYVTALDAAGNESGASNTVTVSTTGGSNCPGGAMTLTLSLDNYPSETSWTIARGGTIVDSGSGYSTAGTTLTKSINLTSGDYTFTIYDSYGDGICCGYGNGSYTLRSGGTVIANGGNFTSSEATGFCVQGSGNIVVLGASDTTPKLGEIVNLYPNPANDFINIRGLSDKVQSIAIYGISGALIREIPSPATTKSIDIATLQAGMYFLSIQTENGGHTTKKFIKQ